ncbi:hypothetical protein CPB84DRAFT_1812647 [Gymnopilus junonius]|uniref:Agroclavine dehydrogenase n=1 Tax=Gymnopilus junonius TaxID=109634 RepID=A0A9P5NZQ6_GYMJU|nr:hypothetical protein CPB84DRAFT_1812647 [Gymnopilus junonius]
MTILITGGTGKTGAPLAKIALAANYPVLLASRTGNAPEPFKGVKFDWFDPKTFENPFIADPNIDRIYLVCPTAADPLPCMKPFIDLAVSKGIKRFVVLSASQIEAGGPLGGKIHQYLIDIGVEFASLRPTWFIQNFGGLFYQAIQEHDQIITATGTGRIPFVSTEDIAQAAFDSLTAEKSPNTDYLIVGPELFSYDEAVKALSSVIGREITHKKISPAEASAIFISIGIPADYAAGLSAMEGRIANGSEVEYFNAERKIVGKYTLKEYFEANKNLWIK